MDFTQFFYMLESYSMTDALLPFLLYFTILFAMLQKTNLLGTGKKNFNVIIAFVIAMLIVIPHLTGRYPPNRDIVTITNNVLPQIGMVGVAIIMALLLLGILGFGEPSWGGNSITGFVAFGAFAYVVYLFGVELGWFSNFGMQWDSSTTSVIIVILVFAIIIWYITKPDSTEENAAKGLKMVKEFGDVFKKINK